ncbi:biotin carboxylase C-terminal domain protein [Mycobacterium xenopi 4042]|uniref:biotin carboxylase n=1 Tax=Mycobacterium xenopi 4042 TaxID=1299334 RepID=X8ANB3_MYCXE|nr:biotin carboxylase C-terminal domain protein [Mycobacterium xenopi 4042]
MGSDYDPMLAKVVAHAADRPNALRTLDRALADTAVLGVVTNVEFARFLLADADVAAGRLDTGLLDRRVGDFAAAPPSDEQLIAAAAYRWLRLWPKPGGDLWTCPLAGASGRPRRSALGCAPATAPTMCISPERRRQPRFESRTANPVHCRHIWTAGDSP